MQRKKQKKRNLPTTQVMSFLSDYGFKAIFADKNDTLFARTTIEVILDDGKKIEKLTFLRNEFLGSTKLSRAGLYDVLCEDEHQRVMILEMQVDNYQHFLERLQYYTFQVFNSNVKKGKGGFNDLAPIKCICFVEDKIIEGDRYHHRIVFKNDDNLEIMNHIEFHLIELGKFPFKKEDAAQIELLKEQILYTMKYAHTIDPKQTEKPVFFEKKPIKTALDKLDVSKMNPRQRALYEVALIDDIVERERRKNERKERKEMRAEIAKAKVEIQENKAEIAKTKAEIDETKQEKSRIEQEKSRIEQERISEKIATISSLLNLNSFTDEQIANIVNASLAQVIEIRTKLGKSS